MSERKRTYGLGSIVAGLVLIVSPAGAASTPPATAASQAASLTRLLPPNEGQTYFGFTFRLWDTQDPAWGDSRSFSERIDDSIKFELGGKTPTFLTVWTPWHSPNESGKAPTPFGTWHSDIATAHQVTGAHSVRYLDWTLTNTTAENGGITTKDIASGSLDDYIRQSALDLKGFGDPVLIRLFGGEFNGSWWYAQSPRANASLTTADFVSAWRRVVDIFRQVGAANVSFAWIPNTYPPTPVNWVDPDIAAYYPGDSYVDWVGADTYDVGPPSWLDPVYEFASQHSKPFFLAEWGVRHDGSGLSPAQERAWMATMFDYFESHPGIQAINYFNYNSRVGGPVAIDPAKTVFLYDGKVNYQANVNDDDYRLLADSGAEFRTTFSSRIGNPRYVSSIRTESVGSQDETATVVLLSVTVHGARAIVRWKGNGAASTYDVGIRPTSGNWKLIATRYAGLRYTIHGVHGKREAVRVRARNASGVPGPWSASRSLIFR